MVRLYPLLLLSVPAFCLLLIPCANAQLKTGNVNVHITFPNDSAPNQQLKVDLISGSSGNRVAETFTNDRGEAQFSNVVIGNYHVVVSGENVQTTQSEEFEIDSRKVAQSILVRVRPSAEAEGNTASGAPTVSAANLKIPKKASKEFDKATELMSKQQWQKAIEHLNKALVIYPNYAQAYTNLGVAYARLGDSAKEREALQKAVSADDHFAPAFVNLGQMEMKQHNFSAAEADLDKAVGVDPTDVHTLVLLAQAALLNSHYQEVIAMAQKVHAMSHTSFASIHYVAARACERLNRLSDAVSQLKLFLSEEPSGPLTAPARQELAALQNTIQSAGVQSRF